MLLEDEESLFLLENCFEDCFKYESQCRWVGVLPPPNVTGELHFGHYLDQMIVDIQFRLKIFTGIKSFIIPGTDSASLATCNQVKKRDGSITLESVIQFADYNRNRIRSQLKNTLTQFDWSKEIYTLDKDYEMYTQTVLKQFYQDGLIETTFALSNWCYGCNSCLSNDEIESLSQNTKMYFLKYFIENTNSFITVCTTRPETIFSDEFIITDLQEYNGVRVIVPVSLHTIPILYFPNGIKEKFKTHFVKMTPEHSKIDYKISEKLKFVNVRENSFYTNGQHRFLNCNFFNSRNFIEKLLEISSSISKIEDTVNIVPKCYKCNSLVCYRKSEQIFILLKKLVDRIETKNSMNIQNLILKNTQIMPDSILGSFSNWIEKMDRWCISRQVIFGTKIADTNHTVDCWFGTSLYTSFVKNKFNVDVSLISCGKDIVFFWIIRMLLMNFYLTGDSIIKKVFFHGLLRDKNGIKLSKTLKNYEDLDTFIERYSNNTLRGIVLDRFKKYEDLKVDFKNTSILEKFYNKKMNIQKIVLKLMKINFTKGNSILHEGFFNSLLYDIKMCINKILNFELNVAYNIMQNVVSRFSNEYILFANTSSRKEIKLFFNIGLVQNYVEGLENIFLPNNNNFILPNLQIQIFKVKEYYIGWNCFKIFQQIDRNLLERIYIVVVLYNPIFEVLLKLFEFKNITFSYKNNVETNNLIILTEIKLKNSILNEKVDYEIVKEKSINQIFNFSYNERITKLKNIIYTELFE